MEHWSKPVSLKNLFLNMEWDWTFAFYTEPLGTL